LIRKVLVLAGGLSVLLPAVTAAQASDRRTDAYPQIAVRITDRDVFARRDPVEVAFRTDRDGYVTVLRVDTDGRMRVLFPADPEDGNYVAGGREFRVPNVYGYDVDHAFAIDDYPGMGYVFAIVSLDPFDYQPYVRNRHWDYERVGYAGGRITGDPYVALTEIVEHMLPPGYGAYSYDVVPYYVEARYEYPRFVCYDCHAYSAYPVWDPYRHWCGTFKLVIYDRPLWYPATLYPATQRVVRGGMHLGPQYLIEARTHTEPHVVRVPASGRRPAPAAGVRGRDIGGVGSVRTPEQPEQRNGGGVGGLIRRLFGGSDEPARRRPIAPGATADDPRPDRQPQLERRRKGDKEPGEPKHPPSRPSGTRRTPGGATAASPSAGRQPAAASPPARRPAQSPAAKPKRASRKPEATPRRRLR
jgi:hypothetical protein